MMERALKERIVGAVVLVVIAVLVVPVFLDGSAGNVDMVSESVVLPGQNGQPRTQQTIVLERDRSQPVPVPSVAGDEPQAPAKSPGDSAAAPVRASPSEAAPPDDTDTAALPTPATREDAQAQASGQQRPSPPAPAAEQPAAEPAPAVARDEAQSTTGMWAVQLGSFSSLGNAERLSAELRAKGYAAFLSRLQNGAKPLHRVRIGPQKDRDSAAKMAARLAADGYKGQVVPHP